jgi:very-short-patch-repair endonuclease
LRQYLEYAERGPEALDQVARTGAGDFDSPFEAAVAHELRSRGWDVHPQVGVQGYRIDLGVVDPDRPGRYLAGIECDGAMYHSAPTARERDRLRADILENQGWNLFRIWSTDWFRHRHSEIDRVVAGLEQLRRGGPKKNGLRT